MGLRLKQVTANTAGNYNQSNTADNQVELALTKGRQITVTSADVDLTTGNSDGQDVNSNVYKALRSVRLEFVGAMDANHNVLLPVDEKIYLVKHSCTGGFTITVKTPSGTGVALVNGDKKLLICDGVNIENALS